MNTPKLSPHAVHKLKWVREKILSQPQLYHQGCWRRETACGTVCCIAGWITLGDPEIESGGARYGFVYLGEQVSMRAKEILGLDFAQARELFDGQPNRDPRFRQDPAIRAQAGAEHIDRFIAENT